MFKGEERVNGNEVWLTNMIRDTPVKQRGLIIKISRKSRDAGWRYSSFETIQ